uniref:Uncharacterized protein n=1 Tax=Anguilla anguilla TaxID=7936 RepID=A0A0E9TRU0_ANGAN
MVVVVCTENTSLYPRDCVLLCILLFNQREIVYLHGQQGENSYLDMVALITVTIPVFTSRYSAIVQQEV